MAASTHGGLGAPPGGFDGRASMMTQTRTAKEASVAALHSKTFGAWVNSHLRHRGLRANDLSTDLRDGCLLIQLVEQLTGQTCPFKYQNTLATSPPATLSQHQLIDNQAIALRFVGQFVPRLNIEPKDLCDGNIKVILGLLWRLILHFQLFSSAQLLDPSGSGSDGAAASLDMSTPAGRKEAQDMLLRWLQWQTNGYPQVHVHDYVNSFADGMALCALVHKICPTAIDFSQITPSRPFDNLRLAMYLAAQHLEVPILIDPADMVNPDPSLRPDDNCMITYLSLFPAAAARYQAKHGIAASASVTAPPPTSSSQHQSSSSGISSLSSGSLPAPSFHHAPPPQPPPQPVPTPAASTSTSSLPNIQHLTIQIPSAVPASQLPPEPSGPVIVLEVRVIESRGLSLVGAFASRPDPYCVLTCYRQKEKTKKLHGEINPKWNAQFTFYIEDPECSLLVEIFSWDRFLAHDFLGQVEIPLSSIPQGATEEEWFPLTGKKSTGRVTGEIALTFRRR